MKGVNTMALTIDDILDKEFLTTKDNSGYLADDVDKFLDEIIEEMENIEGDHRQSE
jgi:DivIVA domain